MRACPETGHGNGFVAQAASTIASFVYEIV
jgi:hypothetical protein